MYTRFAKSPMKCALAIQNLIKRGFSNSIKLGLNLLFRTQTVKLGFVLQAFAICPPLSQLNSNLGLPHRRNNASYAAKTFTRMRSTDAPSCVNKHEQTRSNETKARVLKTIKFRYFSSSREYVVAVMLPRGWGRSIVVSVNKADEIMGAYWCQWTLWTRMCVACRVRRTVGLVPLRLNTNCQTLLHDLHVRNVMTVIIICLCRKCVFHLDGTFMSVKRFIFRKLIQLLKLSKWTCYGKLQPAEVAGRRLMSMN